MSEREKNWHPKFLEYMDYIINHKNYKNLPINRNKNGTWNWVTTKKSNIGKDRIAWCEEKALAFGFKIEHGIYAKTMMALHPTKEKACQICGKYMSLKYVYPNVLLLKKIFNHFGHEYESTLHIDDIWEDLLKEGNSNSNIASFLIKEGGLNVGSKDFSREEIIELLEVECRENGKRLLGPGAMSNFPDRFDGFHSYNRCCRSTQDKGRSKENLKTYSKDRRAYEYWSDGNIHAANKFMSSKLFSNLSADHIGPISLGFIHDSRFIRPLSSNENIAKRDRLTHNDIKDIIIIEKRTSKSAMSWYSKLVWEHIKENYKTEPNSIIEKYRVALKQNLSNFMYLLHYIITSCEKEGTEILEKLLLEPKYVYFENKYKFDDLGNIISSSQRKYSDNRKNEINRFKRIAFNSVDEFNSKENRNIKKDLKKSEEAQLKILCTSIKSKMDIEHIRNELLSLMEIIQKRIIADLEDFKKNEL